MGINNIYIFGRRGIIGGALLVVMAFAFALLGQTSGFEASKEDCRKAHYVCGDVDASFVEMMKSALLAHSYVGIRSYGGHAYYALETARVIIGENATVKIKTVCISACVELILQAFDYVFLIDAPLIASHGNVRMRNLLASNEGVDISSCAGDYLENLDRLMGDRLADHNPQTQIERLGITNVRIEWPNRLDCPIITWDSEADYWALTQSEMEEYFAIEAVGETAADNDSIIQDRINCHIPIGSRVRVNDRILISNGHSGETDCNPSAEVLN